MKAFFIFFEKLNNFYIQQKIKCLTKSKNKVICYGKINLLNRNIRFGKNVILYPNVSFEGNGPIYLGDNVKIGTNTILSSNQKGGLRIGNNTIIAGNSYIIDSNHSTDLSLPIQKQSLQSKEVVIGEDVWIAANVTVIKGGKIGNGVVIGANSLVNSEIVDNTIAYGNPAKKMKERK